MNELPEKIRLALEEFGHSEAETAKFSGDSFVVQDLGIWGDDFDEFYEVLATEPAEALIRRSLKRVDWIKNYPLDCI